MGREENDIFSYVGMDICTVNDVIEVRQQLYIDNLQPVQLQAARAVQRDASLCETEREQQIGQILWVAKQTRPDVMFDTCSLASNTKDTTVQSIQVNKVIRRLGRESDS